MLFNFFDTIVAECTLVAFVYDTKINVDSIHFSNWLLTNLHILPIWSQEGSSTSNQVRTDQQTEITGVEISDLRFYTTY